MNLKRYESGEVSLDIEVLIEQELHKGECLTEDDRSGERGSREADATCDEVVGDP